MDYVKTFGIAEGLFFLLQYSHMVEIVENEIRRSGDQIGRVESNRVYAKGNKKLRYFDKDEIFDVEGERRAYVRGNFLYFLESDSKKISFDKVKEVVKGGAISMIARCAMYVLMEI